MTQYSMAASGRKQTVARFRTSLSERPLVGRTSHSALDTILGHQFKDLATNQVFVYGASVLPTGSRVFSAQPSRFGSSLGRSASNQIQLLHFCVNSAG